jgi:UDP-3-O-[3-hydroxymyristoyl] N-acetylglucosamine deacetylase
LPILDGSSQPFIDMLHQAGVRNLRRRRRYLKVVKPLEFTEGGRRIGIYPADDFSVRCFVEYDHPAVGAQEIALRVNRKSFSSMLAPARTFGFVKDFRACAAWVDPAAL